MSLQIVNAFEMKNCAFTHIKCHWFSHLSKFKYTQSQLRFKKYMVEGKIISTL